METIYIYIYFIDHHVTIFSGPNINKGIREFLSTSLMRISLKSIKIDITEKLSSRTFKWIKVAVPIRNYF